MTRFAESLSMLKGIAHYGRTHQLWSVFHDDDGRAETDPLWVKNSKWRGVISRHTTPQLVKVCAERKIPLVDLNDIAPYPGVPKIRPDNVAIGHSGAEHFMERGFTNFGFCGFQNDGWACERRDGFVEALRLAGHPCEIFDVEYPGDLTPFWDTKQTAALALWLRRRPKPFAVMACNDLRALQLLSAAQAAKILVPEEVSVLGANNDTPRCDLATPPLSSVAVNSFQSGYLAAETLACLMDGKKVETMDRRVEPAEVVTRPSTDILAIADQNIAAALNAIRERACQGISVDEVCRLAFTSRSQLERKFRRQLGRSPKEEISRVQISRVKQLLVETDLPLKRIAEMTGFEHTEYLSVVIRRSTGLPPGAYRSKHQQRIR